MKHAKTLSRISHAIFVHLSQSVLSLRCPLQGFFQSIWKSWSLKSQVSEITHRTVEYCRLKNTETLLYHTNAATVLIDSLLCATFYKDSTSKVCMPPRNLQIRSLSHGGSWKSIQKHIDCHFWVNACRERNQNIHHCGIHACIHPNSINANTACCT